MSDPSAASSLTVAAVIVASDGRPWLPELLASIGAQTRPPDRVVAVDNASSDGTRDLLIAALGPDDVILSDRDMGFAEAVNVGVDAVPEADFVLLLHDDMALDPKALEHLVEALGGDPRVGVVGPKVVDHADPRRLRSVGLTVDRLGQMHDRLEDQDIDQGQVSDAERHLAVTSAGMLVRRDVFASLYGFDRRFELFRDDIDFCWRVWLAGWEVCVVPAARVRHRRAATSHVRLGQTAFRGPHYFRERNALATIIKNVLGWRLPGAVVAFVAAALVRAVWYVMTRRFSEALQTVQAWGWNLAHLRGTWRLRRRLREQQRRTMGQINHLFAALGPRVRAMVSWIGDRIIGDELAPEAVPTDHQDRSRAWRLANAVRRRPIRSTAVALVLILVAVSLPLLAPGAIRLGELQPFPPTGTIPIEDYVAAWHDVGAANTTRNPSPSQLLLGVLQVLSLDNPWLASRLLLLGSVFVAWLMALRALAPVARPRPARVAAATLYVLSPPALAALRTGRVGGLVALVALPAFAIAVHLAMARRVSRATAWRGAAMGVLVAGVGIAFEPGLAVAAAVVLVVAALLVGIREDTARNRRRVWLRLVTIALGTSLVLFPWSIDLRDPSLWWPRGVLPADAATSELWRWLLVAPDQAGFPGIVAGAGVVLAALFGLAFAARQHPVGTLTLGLVAVAGAVGAALVDWQGVEAPLWAGIVLLVAVAAAAGLFAMGLARVGESLAGHHFGWRQVGAGLAVFGVLVGVGASVTDMVLGGWGGIGRGAAPLPSFVMAAGDEEYRVLTIADERGHVAWDIVDAAGGTMADHGVPFSPGLRVTLDAIVGDIVNLSDPSASARLGLLNFRYVVVPESGRSPELARGLDRQFHLQSQPVAAGLVHRVVNDAPPVGFVSADVVADIQTAQSLPDDALVRPLDHDDRSAWTGHSGSGPVSVLVSTAETGQWEATADGRALPPQEENGLLRFDVPADSRVEVTAGDQASRRAALTVQLLAFLFTVSLLLRPPSPARGGPS